jgi:hypothetical protein
MNMRAYRAACTLLSFGDGLGSLDATGIWAEPTPPIIAAVFADDCISLVAATATLPFSLAAKAGAEIKMANAATTDLRNIAFSPLRGRDARAHLRLHSLSVG